MEKQLSPEVERYIKSLDTLKNQFQDAAIQCPGLGVQMMHADTANHDRLGKQIEHHKANFGLSFMRSFRSHSLQKSNEMDTYAVRVLWYKTHTESPTLFNSLASAAGRLILLVPNSGLKLLSDDSIDCDSDFERWIWTVFDLAWLQMPGSALFAERRIHLGYASYQYDLDSLQMLGRLAKLETNGLTSFPESWTEKLPEYYGSEIADICLASTYAIEILEEQAKTIPGIHPTDPLWKTLQSTIRALDTDPGILLTKPLNDEHGLNAKAINSLSQKMGLSEKRIIRIEKRTNAGREGCSIIFVSDPTGKRRCGFDLAGLKEGMDQKFVSKEIINIMQAWQDKRATMLEGKEIPSNKLVEIKSPCSLTITGLAKYIEIGPATIRRACDKADVSRPDAGKGRIFTPHEVARIARARNKSPRCSTNEKNKLNELLTALGESSLDKPLRASPKK